MPACDVCKQPYERVAAFCPTCGAPLTTLAARLREAATPPAVVVLPEAEADDDVVVLPEAETPAPDEPGR